MVNRQCVICKSKNHVFLLPQHNSNIWNKWHLFISEHFPHINIKKSHGICYLHFERPTSFKNYDEWKKLKIQGKKTSLRIHECAVPTIHNPSQPAELFQSEPIDDPIPPLTNIPSTSGMQSSTRQPKRPLSDDEGDFEALKRCNEDPDYDPNQSFIEYGGEDEQANIEFEQSFSHDRSHSTEHWSEEKFIVPWSFLLWALSICKVCNSKDVSVSKMTIGAALKVQVFCNSCHTSYSKATSDLLPSKVYSINYLLSCAILFTGSLPTKFLRILSAARIRCYEPKTFFRHQKRYLNNAVAKVWQTQQNSLVAQLKRNRSPLSVAGDGRCDSMGHSAKYGCYSLMDVATKKVIAINLVQTKGNSNAMEIEGFKLGLKQLFDWNLPIKNFISDRHIQIRAYMRDTYGHNRKASMRKNPEITHYLDVWHVAKSLKKELKAAMQKDSTGLVADWSKAILNHLYWVASSTQEYTVCWSDVVEAKWLSTVNHIINIHRHQTGHYSRCCHPRRKTGQKKVKYMKIGSTEHTLVADIVTDKRRIKDIRQLSPLGQTSNLESFHAVVNHFAPKMFHFQYPAMNTRLRLAAIHFNHNVDSSIEKPSKLMVIYPKYKKGEPTVKSVLKKGASYDYLESLIVEAFEMQPGDLSADAPDPMSQLYSQHIDKEALIASFQTRFAS